MNDLRSRVSHLRRQSGSQADTTPAEHAVNTLEGNTRALRKRLHGLSAPRLSSPCGQRRLTDAELAEALKGRQLADGLILVESFLPFGTPHGGRTIQGGLFDALALLGQAEENHDSAVVFMDTETTGLAGGTGTLVFLLGLGRLTPDGLRAHQYLLTGFRGEQALLGAAAQFLESASTLVSFNGRSFDHPLLAARYRLAGMADPFDPLHHLDLLYPTRCAFASRWEDCRLQTAERRLLDFMRLDDLPGSEVPGAWISWLRFGSTRELPRIIAHNRWDLVSLAALLPALRESYERPIENNADILAVARHHLHRGDTHKAHHTLSENRGRLGHDGLLELARLYRRAGDWPQATAIWHRLAQAEHPEAMEHLAKYYEHIARDMDSALAFTARLLTLQPADPRHRHRRSRLVAKQAAADARHPAR